MSSDEGNKCQSLHVTKKAIISLNVKINVIFTFSKQTDNSFLMKANLFLH